MARLTKKQKEAYAKLDRSKSYDLNAASALIKDITNVKFDASVDIAVRLGVDPRKANQMVRGVVTLPHGTGKDVKVLALVTPDKEAEAEAAGADFVGLDEYLQKIKGGWTDVDVIITMPSCMGKLGPLGRILGPRGLMPNPKTGTVTMDVAKAVKDVKAGKIDFKVDKTGIVHAAIGKASFEADKIADNANELVQTLIKLKPTASKGTYIKSIFMSSTMSPSVEVDVKSVSKQLKTYIMTREEKSQVIQDLTSTLADTDTIYLADISGLDALSTSNLRRACFKANVKLAVVKNTLLSKAMEASDKEFGELKDILKGNTSIMIAEAGNAPAKVIKEFRKKSDRPLLKGAYVEEAVYIGDEQLNALVNIKSREELIGDIVGLLQSPAKNVISALQSGGGKLAGILKTLSEK